MTGEREGWIGRDMGGRGRGKGGKNKPERSQRVNQEREEPKNGLAPGPAAAQV